MKKLIFGLLCVGIGLGCVSTEKHKAIVNELEKKNAELSSDLNKLGMEYQKISDELLSLRAQKQKLEKSLKSEIDCGKVRVLQYENRLVLNIDDKICFPSGSAKLGKEAEGILLKIAESLQEFPKTKVFIEGNTDNVPVKKGSWVKDNWELSAERAISVTRFIQAKIAPNRISIVGNAWFNSIVPNNTDDNKRLNRRVDIVIVPEDEL